MPKKYLHFKGMAWPNPDACDKVERELRYGTAESIILDRMFLASIVAAYSVLVMGGQRTRASHVAGIKAAMKAEWVAPERLTGQKSDLDETEF